MSPADPIFSYGGVLHIVFVLLVAAFFFVGNYYAMIRHKILFLAVIGMCVWVLMAMDINWFILRFLSDSYFAVFCTIFGAFSLITSAWGFKVSRKKVPVRSSKVPEPVIWTSSGKTIPRSQAFRAIPRPAPMPEPPEPRAEILIPRPPNPRNPSPTVPDRDAERQRVWEMLRKRRRASQVKDNPGQDWDDLR